MTATNSAYVDSKLVYSKDVDSQFQRDHLIAGGAPWPEIKKHYQHCQKGLPNAW
jgi:hypothetical protein